MAQMVGEQIGERIVRYYPDEQSRQAASPSYALQKPMPVLGPVPADAQVHPAFSTGTDGQTTAAVSVDSGTSLYGTGEVFGPLLRNGAETIVAYNFDAYAYPSAPRPYGHPNLYESHPWVLALRADGSSYGVLADTTFRCTISTQSNIAFTAKDRFDVVVIERSTPQEVVRALAGLTGTMLMPPKWALGYHQSRFSYFPDSKVREIASGLRTNTIPCDAIWFDIDYMNGYRIFTFDPKKFPGPKKLNDDLLGMGFHSVWMINPAVKKEDGAGVNPVFDAGNVNDVWVKEPDGSNYVAPVWPGPALFPDFTRPDVRGWWGGFFKDYLARDIGGVWNDMNEPAVFDNANNKTLADDSVHRGDPTLVDALGRVQGADRARGVHVRYHNIYGMQMARSTREGIQAVRPDRRPFVLARASYVGGQRYAATWTGDNTANWDHLKASIPMVLNLGISGQPFAGPDIGGYRYDTNLNPSRDQVGKIFARWMGFGALLPFSRGHAEKRPADPKEPYSFNAAVTKTCRLALERRYRLMPYLYGLFREASLSGLPVVRPVFFADPKDPALRAVDFEFLFGPDVLVSVQVSETSVAPPILPRGIWRSFGFDQPDGTSDTQDPDQPRLFLRGGAIVPTGPVMEYTDQKPLDPLTLLVCLDENGRASGTLYEDAGEGFGYQNGQYLLTTYRAAKNQGQVTVDIARSEGQMPRPNRALVIRLILDTQVLTASARDSQPVTILLPHQVEIMAEARDGESTTIGLPREPGTPGASGVAKLRPASVVHSAARASLSR
jgi:alpha-glucosidase